jgi:hypothetical protein
MIALRFAYLLARQRAAFIGKGASSLIGTGVGNDYAKYAGSIRFKHHVSDRRDPEDQDDYDSEVDDIPEGMESEEYSEEEVDGVDNFYEMEPMDDQDYEEDPDEDDDEEREFTLPVIGGGGPRRYPDGASYVAQRFTVQPCEEEDGYDADPDLFRIPMFFDDEKVQIYAKHVLDPKKYSFEALSNETGASVDRIKGVISVMHHRYEMMRKKGFTVRIEALSMSQVQELIEKEQDKDYEDESDEEEEEEEESGSDSDSDSDSEDEDSEMKSDSDSDDDSEEGSDGEKKKSRLGKRSKRGKNDFDETKYNDEELKKIISQSKTAESDKVETPEEKIRKEEKALKRQQKEAKKLAKEAVEVDKDDEDVQLNDFDENALEVDDDDEDDDETIKKISRSMKKEKNMSKELFKAARKQQSLEKGTERDDVEELIDDEGNPLADLDAIWQGKLPERHLRNIPIVFVDIPPLWEEMFDFSEKEEFVGEEEEIPKDYKVILESYKSQMNTFNKEFQLPDDMTVERFKEIVENMDDHYRRLSNVAERERENLDTLDELEEYGADIRFRETPIRQSGMSRYKRNVYKNYYPKLLNDDNYEQVKRTLEEKVADAKIKLPEYDLGYYKMKYDADQKKKELPSFFPQSQKQKTIIKKGQRLAFLKSQLSMEKSQEAVSTQSTTNSNEIPATAASKQEEPSSSFTEAPVAAPVQEQQQKEEDQKRQTENEDPAVRIVNPHRSNSETKPSRWKIAYRDLNKRVGSNIGDSSATIITRTGK